MKTAAGGILYLLQRRSSDCGILFDHVAVGQPMSTEAFDAVLLGQFLMTFSGVVFIMVSSLLGARNYSYGWLQYLKGNFGNSLLCQ
jgi:hypothetical protein